MSLNENYKSIGREIYKNDIRLVKNNQLFVSYIKENLFVVHTTMTKENIDFFDTDKTVNKMNPFFKSISLMLLSSNKNGDGCFDYEHDKTDTVYTVNKKNILNRLHSYFRCELCMILVKLDKVNKSNKIIPLGIFSLNNNFIWNVCTDKKYRSQGHMTTLFKHFIELFRNKELSYIKSDILKLYLLTKNPDFDSVKKFYLKLGFKIERAHSNSDKLVFFLSR